MSYLEEEDDDTIYSARESYLCARRVVMSAPEERSLTTKAPLNPDRLLYNIHTRSV